MEANAQRMAGLAAWALTLGFSLPALAEPTSSDLPSDAGEPVAAIESEPAECAPESEPAQVCEDLCASKRNCRQGIDVTEYKNVLFFNFGSTFAGRLELEYERELHRRVSIFGTMYVVAFDSVGNQRLIGFGGLVGARVFMLGDAPEGIWVSWGIGGFQRQSRPKWDAVDVKLRGMQTGGMVGWTGVWKRFAFTLGGGATYSWGRVEVLGQSVKEGEWDPWFKIGVGVAF